MAGIGVWVNGLFIGIDLIFTGWWFVARPLQGGCRPIQNRLTRPEPEKTAGNLPKRHKNLHGDMAGFSKSPPFVIPCLPFPEN